MGDPLLWLCITGAVLLIVHEIDSAYWREWELFRIPGWLPGFRCKVWTDSGETGFSQGIYQFDTPDQALRYARCPVMRILEKRSVPGSLSVDYLPATAIEE